MTQFPDQQAAPQLAVPAFRPQGGGQPLPAALAVFLGGYLLLLSLNGQISLLAAAIVSGGEGAPALPGGHAALVVGQFLFAIAVVVAGLLLARRPTIVTIIAVLVAVVAPALFVLIQGGRFSGVLRLPLGGDAAAVAYSLLGNPWFHVALVVGVAWLLCRPAGPGWLALLGALVLVPTPYLLTRADVDTGFVAVVMYALSAVVGAGIVAAGKPWRVEP